MHLFVGSTNPVKVNAVTIATSETWPEAVVQGFEVPSGVSEQPMSDDETRQGAENRAKAALEKGLRSLSPQVVSMTDALGIGLEGGVFKKDSELWSTVWVVVVDQEDQVFHSNGARFKLPDAIAQPILAGEEMGPVVGKLLGDSQIKAKQGAIGVLTQNFIDRTEEYSIIAKLAIGLWYGRNWQTHISQ